jgi:hypothetical protein
MRIAFAQPTGQLHHATQSRSSFHSAVLASVATRARALGALVMHTRSRVCPHAAVCRAHAGLCGGGAEARANARKAGAACGCMACAMQTRANPLQSLEKNRPSRKGTVFRAALQCGATCPGNRGYLVSIFLGLSTTWGTFYGA